jgi:imidazolonepropionase-like amidohydrolase
LLTAPHETRESGRRPITDRHAGRDQCGIRSVYPRATAAASVEGGHVQTVGSGRPAQAAAVRDLGDLTLVSGFVEMHAHGGGGGAAFTEAR